MAMQCVITNGLLAESLQQITGIAEKRQSMPIVSHILFRVKTHQLHLISTDTEVELQTHCTLKEPAEPGEATIPGRKLLDICRSLPEDMQLTIKRGENQVIVKTANSHFKLATLPVTEFPCINLTQNAVELNVPASTIYRMLEQTSFAIAQQDVRYYLNGLLLKSKQHSLYFLGSDGHRLALCRAKESLDLPEQALIIPRKAIIELSRLLKKDHDTPLQLRLFPKYIQWITPKCVLISKLIDSRFPNYEAIFPKTQDNRLLIDREQLKQALIRVSVLSNEKNRGVLMQLRANAVHLLAKNAEQEVAEETLEANYQGKDLDLGVNVNYLVDALSHVAESEVQFYFVDADSAFWLKSHDDYCESQFVIMPLKLS